MRISTLRVVELALLTWTEDEVTAQLRDVALLPDVLRALHGAVLQIDHDKTQRTK